MTWTNPKLDWVTNPHKPMAEDLNRIEGNIDFLKTDIETKKGLIVDALASLGFAVSLATPYAELANIINGILIPTGNANVEDVAIGKIFSKAGQVGLVGTAKRMANGTGTLTQISATSAKLTVTGLAFLPSKIYLRGSFRARYSDDVYPDGNSSNHTTIAYSVFENTMIPSSFGGYVYRIMYTFPDQTLHYDTIALSCGFTFQFGGFVMTITQTGPTTKGIDQYATQTWLAVE